MTKLLLKMAILSPFTLVLAGGALAVADQPETDRFGGIISIKAEATGFFYLKMVGGRWFFITLEGHGYIPIGVNHLIQLRLPPCD
jgi:hypothetical protein